jgi:hypothetical protein
MARRAGKAASRKARQRYVPKTPRPTPAPSPAPETETAPSAPADSTVARETGSADQPRRTAPVAYASGGSTLSVRERAEYHYVERDLRNIGVLSLVMVVMLIAAYFLFDAVGIIR